MSWNRIAVGFGGLTLIVSCIGFVSTARGQEHINFNSGTVTVPGNIAWTDTGIDVSAGDAVLISAKGTCVGSSIYGGGYSQFYGPEGLGAICDDPNRPMPSIAFGALIGRIGNGPLFGVLDISFIGVADGNGGRLYLGVNDGVPGDNSGQFWASILVVWGWVSAVGGPGPDLGNSIHLKNPISGPEEITFEMVESGRADLSIFDSGGRLVRNLVSEDLAAGLHKASWDGTSESGGRLTNGVYFVRLLEPNGAEVQKAVLIDR